MFNETSKSPFSQFVSDHPSGASGPIIFPIPNPSDLHRKQVDPDTNKPIISLSHSSLNQLSYCPRKYQFRKRFYQPDYSGFDEFLAAASGTSIHEYVQSRLRGESHDEATFKFFTHYSFASEARENAYNLRYRTLEPAYYTAVTLWDQLGINPEDIASFEIDNADGTTSVIPGTEFKFLIRLDRDEWQNTYYFRGAIDLVRRGHDGRLRAGDIKTQRSTLDDNAPHYRYSPQLTPYGLVISHLTGEELRPFPIDYYSFYIDLLDPKVEHYQFERTPDDVNAWLQSVLLTIGNMETYTDNEVWPRSTTGCVNFNRVCPHFDYCHISDQKELQAKLLRDGRYNSKAPSSISPHVTIDLEF